jgi:hypothetical protein
MCYDDIMLPMEHLQSCELKLNAKIVAVEILLPNGFFLRVLRCSAALLQQQCKRFNELGFNCADANRAAVCS